MLELLAYNNNALLEKSINGLPNELGKYNDCVLLENKIRDSILPDAILPNEEGYKLVRELE
jgi:hypothetical protein